MNIDFKKKNVRIILVALVGLIAYTLASFMSVKYKGVSGSSKADFIPDIWFEDGYGFITFVGLVCIVAFIAIIATAYLKKNNENLLCSLAGGAAAIVSLIATLVKCSSLKDEAWGASFSVGIGQWIGILALLGCAAMAFFLPNDEQ